MQYLTPARLIVLLAVAFVALALVFAPSPVVQVVVRGLLVAAGVGATIKLCPSEPARQPA